MKRFPLIAFLVSAIAVSLHANPQARIALVNGTLINPGTGQVVPNAFIMIEGDRISAVGDQATAVSSKDAQIVDCKGKFILPGYIDTHVHFFQSGDIYTRPDAVDLTSVRPYKDELAWIERNLRDTFARYIRCGITSVVDVGGPMSNFRVRNLAKSIAKAPRVAVAGPLISSVSRPQLDLGDPPIVKIDTPEQGREMVRKLARRESRLHQDLVHRQRRRVRSRNSGPSSTPSSRKATRSSCAWRCTPPNSRPPASRSKKAPNFSSIA